MQVDISREVTFKTARSGGKGGQNVNKVETMVEGRWHVDTSALICEVEKTLIKQQLANRITQDGFLLVKSQTARTQIGNKNLVVKKMNDLVMKALKPKKPRIITKIPKAEKQRRLENKKQQSFLKEGRKRIRNVDF